MVLPTSSCGGNFMARSNLGHCRICGSIMPHDRLTDEDPTIPGYTRNGKIKDRRQTPYSSSRMHHPMITWTVIAWLAAATAGGAMSYGKLESAVYANHDEAMSAIEHEKELRVVAATNINENVDEVKEDVRDLQNTVEQDAKETQRLLRQLLQKDL